MLPYLIIELITLGWLIELPSAATATQNNGHTMAIPLILSMYDFDYNKIEGNEERTNEPKKHREKRNHTRFIE